MSLHSKELFHSNFLAWLGETSELRQVFEAVMIAFGVSENEIKTWGDYEVLREKNNFDIVVKAADKLGEPKGRRKPKLIEGEYFVVIEAKIKSIPTLEQLERYDDKLSMQRNVHKLLMVMDPNLRSPSDKWRVASCAKMADTLARSVGMVNDDYARYLILDYATMVKSLTAVVANTTIDLNELFIKETDKELYELRIADLADKWWASHLANLISHESGFACNCSYTNQAPLIDTCIEFNNIRLGIQIQHGQYRHFIMAPIDKSQTKHIPELSHNFLCANRAAFRRKMIERFPGAFKDRKVKGEDKLAFCSYGSGNTRPFWYQYAEITPKATVSDIISCIKADMTELKDLANKGKSSHPEF